jgi:hypothetical protein
MTTGMSLKEVRIIDPVLSRYAQGFNQAELIWSKIAPPVSVTASGGQVLEFGKEAFRLYNSSRAPGGATKRISFGYAGKPYALRQKSLEGQLPREHIRDARAVLGIDLQQRAVNLPLRALQLELEYDVAQLVTTDTNYASGHAPTILANDKWDAYTTSNPIVQIKNARELIRSKTGMYPNKLALGAKPWEALKDHPKILERYQYSTVAILTLAMVAEVLSLDEIIVGKSTFADENDELQDVWGNYAVLFNQPMGTTYEVPAFAYTYTMQGHPLVEQSYYENNSKTWYFPVTYEREPVMASNIAGYLFKDALAA